MLSRLEAARVSEEQADELLNSQEEKQAASIEKKDIETAVEDLEETLMKSTQFMLLLLLFFLLLNASFIKRFL